MAYSAITAGEKDADSTINVGLIGKMIDNPESVFDGTATVKIADGAFNSRTLSGSKLVLSAISSDELGADCVGNSELATNAVKQANVSTSTASNSVTNPSAGTANVEFIPTGAGYILGWEVRSASSDVTDLTLYPGADDTMGNSLTTSYQALYRLSVTTDATASGTSDAQHTYISASPPYVLGNIDIPYFCYLLLDANGDIKASSTAFDAPWAYNGPHKCAATRYAKVISPLSDEDQRKVKSLRSKISLIERETELNPLTVRIKEERKLARSIKGRVTSNPSESDIVALKEKLTIINQLVDERAKKERRRGEIYTLDQQIRAIENTRHGVVVPKICVLDVPPEIQALKNTDYRAYRKAKAEIKPVELDLTPEMKNRNMPYVPAPFKARRGEKIVMLAPDDEMMADLIELHDDPEESAHSLILKDQLRIKSEVSISDSPPGVAICRAAFK